jgi:hypothetical protein
VFKKDIEETDKLNPKFINLIIEKYSPELKQYKVDFGKLRKIVDENAPMSDLLGDDEPRPFVLSKSEQILDSN